VYTLLVEDPNRRLGRHGMPEAKYPLGTESCACCQHGSPAKYKGALRIGDHECFARVSKGEDGSVFVESVFADSMLRHLSDRHSIAIVLEPWAVCDCKT
jgi:hypothetical protein